MLPTSISEKECEQWFAQGVGVNSAERTAGMNRAKLNSAIRR